MKRTASGRPRVGRPSWLWFVALDGGIVVLVTLSVVDVAYDAVTAGTLAPFPSRKILRGILAGTVVIHVVEGVAAARVARRHGLPARGWGLQTLALGFPSLFALRRATTVGPAESSPS